MKKESVLLSQQQKTSGTSFVIYEENPLVEEVTTMEKQGGTRKAVNGIIMSRADGTVRQAHGEFKSCPEISKVMWNILLDAGTFLSTVNDETFQDIIITLYPNQYQIKLLNDEEMLVTKIEAHE